MTNLITDLVGKRVIIKEMPRDYEHLINTEAVIRAVWVSSYNGLVACIQCDDRNLLTVRVDQLATFSS